MKKDKLIDDFIAADITDPSAYELIEKFIQNKTIDFIINNAGIGSKGATLKKETIENIKYAFQLNVSAPFMITQIVMNSHQASKLQCVVNISSRRGSINFGVDPRIDKTGCSYAYRITKAAQNMLTACLYEELKENNIRVLAIHPGKLISRLGVTNAALAPNESANRLFNLLDDVSLSGKFISLENSEFTELPW